jgi:hypothetical protein
MSDGDAIAQQLGNDILLTQERFTAAIVRRLPQMTATEREGYLALLSMLTGKLEEPEKPLRQAFQEAGAQALPILMQFLASR